jgi:hypothetical protein
MPFNVKECKKGKPRIVAEGKPNDAGVAWRTNAFDNMKCGDIHQKCCKK